MSASPMAVPSSGLQPVERRVQLAAVGRRGDERHRSRGEGDDPDADVPRQLIDERLRRLTGGIEPSRCDVRRLHRTGDVDGEHDRGVLARNGDDHRRAGQAEHERRDRGEVDRRRHVAPPRRAARGEVREQVQVREADRVARSAALGPRVQAQQDRDQQQAQEQEWREEGHVGRPVVSRPRAKAGSQAPCVERRRWRMPSRANSAATAERSAMAASRNVARSRRSAVSTRRVRPVSGSMSVSSPTSTRSVSRGSATSIARTVWRPATGGQGGAPVERSAEVGHDRHETRARARCRDGAQGVRQGGDAGALLGRVARQGPQQAQHPLAPAGGWRDALAVRPEGDDPEPVRAPGHEPTHHERRALRDVGLAPVGRPEVHRGRLVQHDPGGELAIRHVLADLRDVAAGRGVPVDPANVVAGLIRRAGDRGPAPPRSRGRDGRRAAGHPRGESGRPRGGGRARRRWGPVRGGPACAADRRPRARSTVMPWPRPPAATPTPARSRCGAGTRPSTRSTTESGVMPSVSAAYDSTSRWRRTSGASSATSDGSA